jgi:hypothetical protein
MQTAANMMIKALRTGKRDLERAVMICFTAWILPNSLLKRWGVGGRGGGSQALPLVRARRTDRVSRALPPGS